MSILPLPAEKGKRILKLALPPRPGKPSHVVIIAEVALAHDGSLGMAHAFIDAIATTGADAVKFQTHIADAESTPDEPWRVKFSPQDKTRYDYWKRMEFTPEQWYGLKTHCIDKGLYFISTPFSTKAFNLLNKIGVSAWKVASGEVNNKLLVQKMAATGRPVLLSTGMSPLEEIDKAVEWIKSENVSFAVMQCTSSYPCSAEQIGINNVPLFHERYGISGLSDHSGTIFPSLSAVTLGATVIEVHVTMSKYMFGPDVPASLTIEELAILVKGIRFIETMITSPKDKNEISRDVQGLRKIFMKSVVTAVPVATGTILQEKHLAMKKPGIGIPPYDLDKIIGKRVVRDLPANHILSYDDLEG